MLNKRDTLRVLQRHKSAKLYIVIEYLVMLLGRRDHDTKASSYSVDDSDSG